MRFSHGGCLLHYHAGVPHTRYALSLPWPPAPFLSAHLALPAALKRNELLRQVENWRCHEVSVSVPTLVYHLPHARRPGNIALEGDVDTTTWPLELAKLSNVVGTTLWLDGTHIRGRIASDALSAQQALQDAVVALAVTHGKQAPEFGRGAVPATSTPDRHQYEPPHRCDAVRHCGAMGCGGIASTPSPMDVRRLGTSGGPAPMSGTWHQSEPHQELVCRLQGPGHVRNVVQQQASQRVAHQQAPVIAPVPYQALPGAGFAGIVGAPAPCQDDPRQQQQVWLPQGPGQVRNVAHQQLLMAAQASHLGTPGNGFAGTVGAPAPHQHYPGQQQEWSYQAFPGAGFAGTVGGLAPHQHYPDQQQQAWPPQWPVQPVQQPPTVAQVQPQMPPGAGWDWGADNQVAGPRASEPDESAWGAPA